jgi:hypothetical protein
MSQVNHVVVSGTPSAPESKVKVPIPGTKSFHFEVLGNLPPMDGEAFDLGFDPRDNSVIVPEEHSSLMTFESRA